MIRILILAALAATTLAAFPDASSSKFIREEVAKGNANKLWALIVAGSNTWDNYRHQADAYHAYQIMKRHGLPDSQIVLMHYDDIASDPSNPTPGIIINRPNGSDVYHGVLKDYTGDNVNAANFINILTGNATAMKGIGSGKVINSGPHDHVFVNFVDHGGPGIIAFPNDELAATDLNAAIMQIYKQKRFARLLFYMEACESGSMFDGLLPNNINVFATTAASPTESSCACYLDNLRQTYLGDSYSVNWMEDSDREKLKKETLQAQFVLVRNESFTTLCGTQTAQEYGTLSESGQVLADFFGRKSDVEPMDLPEASQNDAVPSEHVHMTLLTVKMETSTSAEERAYWSEQIRSAGVKRTFLMKTIVKIAKAVAAGPDHVSFLLRTRRAIPAAAHPCLAAANKFFSKKCFSLAKNEYALFNAPRFLANACIEGVPASKLIKVMEQVCTHRPMIGIH